MEQYNSDIACLYNSGISRAKLFASGDGSIHQGFDLTHWSRLVDLLSMAWAGGKVNPLNHHLCLWVP
jgi:hypothetical protein